MFKNSKITITCSKILIVEGLSDKRFFTSLMINRGITGFNVFCPWDMETKMEGEDSIVHLLKALPVNRNFSIVEKIIIVIDADNNSEDKFIKFSQILANVAISGENREFPVPTEKNILSKPSNGLSVAILPIPLDETTGALETLCFSAAMSIHKGYENCINSFAECAGISNWSPQKIAKFKLRALISMLSSKNPDLPTTNLWDKDYNIVPLEAEAFDSIDNYLSKI